MRPAGDRFLEAPAATRVTGLVLLLVAYHIVGFLAYPWILRRRWAVSLYVPLGWAVIIGALATSPAFSLLILGAILQGFIFLPFWWGIGTLALVVAMSLFEVLVQSATHAWGPSLTLARMVGLVATGLTVGTVMLYIHRSNRDAAIRSRLLRRLDEAQRDLAERSRESGVQEERQRLARDIHDTLAQGFTSVIKHLEAIELSLGSADAGISADEVMRSGSPSPGERTVGIEDEPHRDSPAGVGAAAAAARRTDAGLGRRANRRAVERGQRGDRDVRDRGPSGVSCRTSMSPSCARRRSRSATWLVTRARRTSR